MVSEVGDVVKKFFEQHLFRIIYLLGIVFLTSSDTGMISVGHVFVIGMNGIGIIFYIGAMFRPEFIHASNSVVSGSGTINYWKMGLYCSENLLYTGLIALLHYYPLAIMTFFVITLAVPATYKIAKERKKKWLQ